MSPVTSVVVARLPTTRQLRLGSSHREIVAPLVLIHGRQGVGGHRSAPTFDRIGFRGSRVQIPPSRLKRRAVGLAVFSRTTTLQSPPLKSRSGARRAHSSQEHHRCLLGSFERGGRLGIGVVAPKDRGIAREVPLERVDPILVAGMIRQELRDLLRPRVLELPEQPHQAPRIASGRGSHVGAGLVGAGFRLAGIGQGMELAEQQDRQGLSGAGSQQNRTTDFSPADLFLLLQQLH